MPRFRRTAILLACCTPAGLFFAGCGQQESTPIQAAAKLPVSDVSLPPLREPRLLPPTGDVRPAGDWVDASDASLRQSERHLRGADQTLQRGISAPSPTVDLNPNTYTGPVARPAESPRRPTMPTQVGPYPMDPPPVIREPAPETAAPRTAALPTNVAPQTSTTQPITPPSFTGLSLTSPTEQPQEYRQIPPLEPPGGPVIGPPRDRSGFRAVAERIHALNLQAVDLANRGALYAAREDLIQSLRIATQSLDAADGTNAYSQALDQGFTALQEAEDFALHGAAATTPIPVEQIVVGHRTPVLKDRANQEIPPVIAMQQYYGYAGERLTFAAGELPAAADTLYWLGKVHNALARQSVQADRLQGPQAMVCFRAALSVAPQHYLAANELGVLLARYGQLHDAKKLLQQSVTTRSHPEGWQNLAIVHQRLGEKEMAALAEQELYALTGQRQINTSRPAVHWLEPKAFAKTGGQPGWDTPSAAPLASQPRSPGARR
jgi:tetratricopeptide (TPR) repeat protein